MRLVSKWNALFPTEIPNGNFPKFLVNGKQPISSNRCELWVVGPLGAIHADSEQVLGDL